MAGEDYTLRLVDGVPTVVTIEDTLHTYAIDAGTVSVGDVVYQVSSADEKVARADADSSSANLPVGVTVELPTSTTAIVVHAGGIASGLSSLTRGSSYWLSTTAGALTSTRPSSNAFLVGVALSATKLLVICSPIDVGGAPGTNANSNTNYKDPVRIATAGVGNITLSGLQTLDGIALSANDRVGVVEQTTQADRGIYLAAAGAWTRALDFDSASADGIRAGVMFYVQEGTNNAQTRITLTTTGTITIGSTSLEFIQEAPLVRTDASPTSLFNAQAFSAAIQWSSLVDTRDYSEVSIWFNPTTLGSNTQVDIYTQWYPDASTITADDNNGVQQTDVTISSTTGIFSPKDYLARLTTSGSELVADRVVMLSAPKKGNRVRFGILGNNTSGTFNLHSLRIA
jgi:hypothetical protein